MDGYFIGTILPWPMDWVPADWLSCEGQTISQQDYPALCSIIGTRFAGRTGTFKLPDLRGYIPVGMVNVSGSNYNLGETDGVLNNTLSINNIPPHNHTVSTSMKCSGNFSILATSSDGNVVQPDNNSYFAKAGATIYNNNSTTTKDVKLPVGNLNISGSSNGNISAVVGNTGKGAAISNCQPYVALKYIICANSSYYPTRD
jgi:microcystin-dependent protein